MSGRNLGKFRLGGERDGRCEGDEAREVGTSREDMESQVVDIT